MRGGWVLGFLVFVAAVVGCRGKTKVVGQVNVGEAEKQREFSVMLEGGKKYVFIEEFDFDESGVQLGKERKHCYRWKIDVLQEGQPPTSHSCVPFMSRSCFYSSKSGGSQSGSDCHILRCSMSPGQSGKATVRVKLTETRCTGPANKFFYRDIKLSELVFKMAKKK